MIIIENNSNSISQILNDDSSNYYTINYLKVFEMIIITN